MAYSDFDLRTARERFGLSLVENVDLFGDAKEVTPSAWLLQTLDEGASTATTFGSEKARSEFIITPVLIEAVRQAGRRVNLFSGATFDIDRDRGLSGACDFLVSRSPEKYFIDAPVAAIVEAKREDIIAGFGQCAAALVAAQLFNARQDRVVNGPLFGCVTSGSNWHFLQLDGTVLTIDRIEYYLTQLGKVLGILTTMFR